MTAVSQNFAIDAGDASAPIFTVQDQNGKAIDLSAVVDIVWSLLRSADATAAVLQKKKSLGQVAFVNTGVDGQFQVTITVADTAPLAGNYFYKAQTIDGAGNVSTVAVGTVYFGVPPAWTYDATQLATSSLMQVRLEIGDTAYSDQLLYDEEINFFLSQRPNIYGAGADACRAIASKFARQIDIVQGTLKENYSNRQRAYEARAQRLDFMATTRGGGLPYAGGISAADKENQVENADRVTPSFNIGLNDNYLPVAPAGQVIPGTDPGQAADGGSV